MDKIITRTRCWVDTVVVGCNFCPFAKRELETDRVRFVVSDAEMMHDCLEAVFGECEVLDSHTEIETTLVIFPYVLSDFDDFLNCAELSEKLLVQQGYEGIYQIASFHPDYRFADTDGDDAANYTNRSPYPMLHLLRAASLEKAIASHPDPEAIPERNINVAREKGLTIMQSMLDECRGK